MKRSAFLLGFGLLAATGCAPRSMLMVDVFMAGYAAGQASTQQPVETPLEEDAPIARIESVPTTPTNVDLQPAPPAPELRPFDASVAYAAIANADLAACRPAPGYVHVSMSFSPDGTASGVSLALPPGSTADARICADAALRATRIPAFSGTTPAMVHRAVYVSAA
jgi:hypothetical protein